jgi:hypothetical protein
MALETERATYHANLLEMLPENEDRFVVIKDQEILGAFEDYDKALEAGYERYGPVPFLVRRVQHHKPIHYFSRDPTSCRP